MNPIDRQILQIALPSIVSNITVPLLGLIDVAIVGHLGSPAYIGAICSRRHAVQYHLLDIRLSAYGNQRHDITGLRQAGPAGNCPPADTFGGDRTCRGIMPYPAASSYQASGFPDYPPHGRSQGNGNALLSYLHMGRSRHAGAIRTLRMVHRYAELPYSHVHSHYAEHCQHHGKPQPCLFLR